MSVLKMFSQAITILSIFFWFHSAEYGITVWTLNNLVSWWLPFLGWWPRWLLKSVIYSVCLRWVNYDDVANFCLWRWIWKTSLMCVMWRLPRWLLMWWFIRCVVGELWRGRGFCQNVDVVILFFYSLCNFESENSPSNTGFESETFQAENTTTLDSVCTRAHVVSIWISSCCLTYRKVLCTSVSSILLFLRRLWLKTRSLTQPQPPLICPMVWPLCILVIGLLLFPLLRGVCAHLRLL